MYRWTSSIICVFYFLFLFSARSPAAEQRRSAQKIADRVIKPRTFRRHGTGGRGYRIGGNAPICDVARGARAGRWRSVTPPRMGERERSRGWEGRLGQVWRRRVRKPLSEALN